MWNERCLASATSRMILASMSGPKIVIAGTGRAGTTLLVQIMTDLGFDTGFNVGGTTRAPSKPGMEKNILAPDAPRVIKSPLLSSTLGPLLEQGLVDIEHVIIPVRDLDVAAASRIRAANYGRSLNAAGGLWWGEKRASRQRTELAEVLAQLIVTLARFDIPHTLLLFPRFASDPEYTHTQLASLDASLNADDFRRALKRHAQPDQIHEYPLNPSERWRMRWNAPIALAKRAIAAVNRRLTG